METIIYTLTDPRDNSVKYVGKSYRLNARYREHLKEEGKYRKITWINKLRSLGLQPIMEELDRVSTAEEDFWEIYWIAQIKAWGFELLNHTKGGHNPPIVRKYGTDNNFKKPEVASKIMEMNHARKGKTYEELYGTERAAELKQQIKDRTTGKNNPRFGAIVSVDTKHKIGAANTGENNGMFGKSLSSIHIEAIRQSRLKGKIYQYTLDGIFVKEWDHVNAVVEIYGNSGNICSCLNGKRKSAYGYLWTRKKPD